MARRGRPKHPDILTPREWEVLGLLRDGLSNDEIGRRLGISIRGVKFHVSEILGKLGVENRHDAAAWSPEEHRPWWAALAPIGLLRRNAAPIAAASVVLVVVAGIGGLILALVVARLESADGLLVTVPCEQAIPELGADAQVLAHDTVASASDDVLVNARRRDAVQSELEHVLSVIEQADPNVADVRAVPSYAAGNLLLDLEGDLLRTAQRLVPRPLAVEQKTLEFTTGNEAFDNLNHSLGVHAVSPQWPRPGVLLCMSELMDAEAAAVAYSRVDGVANASANGLFTAGGGPDIGTVQEDEVWYVVYLFACLTGCPDQYRFYTVTGDVVSKIPIQVARTMPQFQRAAENAGIDPQT
jgi:DNA-binding CsgD family transcriptional regulator